MRCLAFAVLALLASMSAGRAQESRMFGDWVVGCDNTRRCSAIGLAPADGDHLAFLSVTRDGHARAEPRLTVALYAEALGSGATLALAFDDGSADLRIVGQEQHYGYVRAVIPGASLASVLDGFRRANRMTVTGDEGTAAATVGAVSLSGAMAALRFMDDRQRRAGTVTALTARGDALAATIPAAPTVPVVDAERMRELPDPARALPAALAGIGSADDGCRDGADPIAARLPASLTLWGVCESAGAYNLTYALYLVGGGEVWPAVLEVPDFETRRGLVDLGNLLVNPYIVEDGLVLSSFYKGRGIGDCGVIAEWGWDGAGFRLLNYTAMDECRGVPVDDWPVLYRARRR